MADPYVREVGSAGTIEGCPVTVGVDYDSVSIQFGSWTSGGGFRMESHQAERFAQAFVSACWQAGQNARQMSAEADVDP